MMSMYDQVLITGAGGMLARALITALRSRGAEVLALTHSELDITDADAISKAFFEQRPSLVLNCAAYTKVDLAEQDIDAATRINALGPANLHCTALTFGNPLVVHYSTDFVFDGSAKRPYRPKDRTNPLSVYGESKLLGERNFVKLSGRLGLIIRTSWLYGPGGPNFVQTMLNAARAGKPLKVVNDQTGSPTFTHDLAEATLNLIDAGATGIYHVTNSGQTTWFEFTRAILEEFDLEADLSPTTSAEWKQMRPNSATRPAYSVLDCSDYERVTGKKLAHWRDALHRYRLALTSD
jgi:dTDP-4-dehydrorhamnose reductase